MTTVAFANSPAFVQPADCDANRTIRFDLALADFEPNSLLQLWAAPQGTDCSDQTNRTGGYQICTELVAGVALATTTGADVPAQSLGLCADGGATSTSVQALYFAPGNTSTATVSAVANLSLETPAEAAASSSASNDDGGCSASGHATCSSSLLGLGVFALCALARITRRRRRGILLAK